MFLSHSAYSSFIPSWVMSHYDRAIYQYTCLSGSHLNVFERLNYHSLSDFHINRKKERNSSPIKQLCLGLHPLWLPYINCTLQLLTVSHSIELALTIPGVEWLLGNVLFPHHLWLVLFYFLDCLPVYFFEFSAEWVSLAILLPCPLAIAFIRLV